MIHIITIWSNKSEIDHLCIRLSLNSIEVLDQSMHLTIQRKKEILFSLEDLLITLKTGIMH